MKLRRMRAEPVHLQRVLDSATAKRTVITSACFARSNREIVSRTLQWRCHMGLGSGTGDAFAGHSHRASGEPLRGGVSLVQMRRYDCPERLFLLDEPPAACLKPAH